jgi:SAM-dependent methyltransferase
LSDAAIVAILRLLKTEHIGHPMTHASTELRAYYAERAAYYDAVYLRPERQSDISYLADHLPSRLKSRAVLEVACGTGYWTQHIAPATRHMVATDATPEPLAFARLRPNTGNVIFIEADAYAWPRNLGEFDGAFAGLWFSHIPVSARVPFLEGLRAMLTSGARVLFLDNSAVQLNDFPVAETDAEGNTYQHRTLRDGSIHRVLKNFPSRQELEKLLEPFARSVVYLELENFWLCEYEYR